jgi:hypothetical protein
MDEGEQLPDEVLLAILCHVARDDVRALCQATAVCRRLVPPSLSLLFQSVVEVNLCGMLLACMQLVRRGAGQRPVGAGHGCRLALAVS